MELCRELINDRNSGRKRPPTRRSSLPRSMAPPPHPHHPHHHLHPLQNLHHLLVATSTPRLVLPTLVSTTLRFHQTERYASDTFLNLDCLIVSMGLYLRCPPTLPYPPPTTTCPTSHCLPTRLANSSLICLLMRLEPFWGSIIFPFLEDWLLSVSNLMLYSDPI